MSAEKICPPSDPSGGKSDVDTSRLIVRALTGAELAEHIPDLAKLRLRVFREWPYLYDGDEASESEYLRVYAESPSALIVLVKDGETPVGVSTAVPLIAEPEPMREALRAGGIDPETVLYSGESLLYPEYRGLGLGCRFFAEREKHARSLGLAYVAFCRVIRDKSDPRRPGDYVDLDAYWRNRGYTLRPDIRTNLSWKEVGSDEPLAHSMEFWIKKL